MLHQAAAGIAPAEGRGSVLSLIAMIERQTAVAR
jgi:hypothetical protein